MKCLSVLLGMALTVVLILPSLVLANTVESSTMYFQGSLSSGSGNILTGTINAIAGTYYLPGGPGTTWDENISKWVTPDGTDAVGGWDVYAKQGGTAYYDDTVQGTIGSDHDGYPGPSGGGWGAFYSPDVPDWNHYQLTLTTDHWYLEYKGSNLGTPMSGAMNWTTMYASEDDVGSYRGTVPSDPDANDGDAALNGGGAGAWDMDWTWGSEVIPLEYPGFAVGITNEGSGNYTVSLTPVPLPAAVWAGMPLLGALAGLRLKRRRRA